MYFFFGMVNYQSQYGTSQDSRVLQVCSVSIARDTIQLFLYKFSKTDQTGKGSSIVEIRVIPLDHESLTLQ